MIKKISPIKFITGFKQVIFTFSQTSKLIWSANPRLLIAVLVINILSGLLVFPTFYIEKVTIDALIQNIGNPLVEEAIRTLGFLFAIRVTIGVFQSGIQRVSSMVQYRITRVFSAHIDWLMGEKVSHLDMQTLEDPEFQDRFNKIKRESGQRAWGLALNLAQIPNFFFSLVSTFALLFLLNPLIALVILVLSIPEFFVDARFGKINYEFESRKQAKYRIWGYFNHYLTNARNFMEIKIFGLSPYFLKGQKGITDAVYKEAFSIRKKRETAHFLAYLPQNIFAFFFSVYLGMLTISKIITVGSAQMYLRAIYSVQGSLTGLVSAFVDLYENYLFVTDLIWFLNLDAIILPEGKELPVIINKGIEFKNVWFRYKEDQPWILKGIDLTIGANENMAIVGENGAGKTTLIKLLCRFYDPQKGEILLNGINIKDYNRDNYWKEVAILFQDFESFPFSGRESIGYGQISEVENLELIKAAAKKAVIHNFLDSLPLHYENPLDTDFEKGVRPSGGQQQRIGLARVLLRNAKLIVLDEPTSNVDPKSEEEIFRQLIKNTQKAMLVLISHRFSTVRRADKIIVMDKGKIIECGTHQQLMKKKGLYEELFNLQAKSYK